MVEITFEDVETDVELAVSLKKKDENEFIITIDGKELPIKIGETKPFIITTSVCGTTEYEPEPMYNEGYC